VEETVTPVSDEETEIFPGSATEVAKMSL
jgi:hypothetical protein